MASVKLYQTLFILQKCNIVIQRVTNRVRQVEGDQIDLKTTDQDFVVDSAQAIILELNIFLDEYDRHFPNVEQPYQMRVKACKKITSPIIGEIRKWKDLKTVRDRFLAHNCRDK